MMVDNVRVSVFGGSKPEPGEDAYRDSKKLGRLLAEAGFSVVTGGYIGAMEAVSRGAAQAGGHVIGITCDEIENWRPVRPNQWVKEEMRLQTLKMRLYALINICEAAIALPGGIGTLQEIIVMWSQIQIGAITPKPLILVGNGWKNTFQALFSNLGDYIDPDDWKRVQFSKNVDSSVELLITLLAETKQ